MPIYEYSCRKCEHQFEVLIRSKTDYPETCPKCGTAKPVKMLSAFAVSAAQSTPEFCSTCPSAASAGCGCRGGACPHA